MVLTHAHFDHTGCAARLQDRLGVPIWLHAADEHLAAHPYSYAHENPRSVYPLRHPRAVPILAAMARAGALHVPGVRGTRRLEPGTTLPLPGSPRVVQSPGHTAGHCALHLPDRDVEGVRPALCPPGGTDSDVDDAGARRPTQRRSPVANT
ncbi:MBL fold metallo-hydrolase [Isoptericola variabilis]|uniref:MBL fold metallo-hydrolase n=1 Tax=Isoptericola variabilis TaxID=139208 RepID=UPI00067427B0|nr:MBL fold metallo-hydrolase [Isoptericola variabilis]TWH28068.1 Zn-dependent hydrolases, including glyoxylases [Isoptericola variabilis J7]